MNNRLRRIAAIGLGLWPSLMLGSLVPAVAEERYFVLIFSSESVPKRPRYTHTWATAVRVVGDPADSEKFSLESQTISWMPRTLNIRPLALRGECGVNLGLEATIRDCLGKRECIAMWGPYEYDRELGPTVYERVRRQIARLNGGRVWYKCVDPDTGPSARYMSNCIHAVTDLDPYLARPSYNELTRNGQDAGRYLVQIMAGRHRIDTSKTHDWIAQALGIGDNVHRASVGASP
jgi:hypothetical protein